MFASTIHGPSDVRAMSHIAISRRVKRDLISGGISPEKITLIDDMVDLESFNPKSVKTNVLRRDFSTNGPVLVGIVGRIGPSKRQLEFLQAARQIVRDLGRSCGSVGRQEDGPRTSSPI